MARRVAPALYLRGLHFRLACRGPSAARGEAAENALGYLHLLLAALLASSRKAASRGTHIMWVDYDKYHSVSYVIIIAIICVPLRPRYAGKP